MRAYKWLSTVERAVQSFKTIDHLVRPIHHRLADRLWGHVFLCMLAYYVEWHMHRALALLRFKDDDPAAGEAQRISVVRPAQRFPRAHRKARTKRTDEEAPVHSFRTLLEDLTTVAKNRVRPKAIGAVTFSMITIPTPLQQRAFELLGVSYQM